ncbi:MAG: hypothetical protein PHC75_08400 [Burkholderiales bacterium]|nr:hypothetical protein [Burkholderiales bacterium]
MKFALNTRATRFAFISILSITSILVSSCSGGSSNNTNPTSTSNIIFGTQNGLVFNNNQIIPGQAGLDGVDGSKILSLVIDANNNVYASTFGLTFDRFGAGKVFKYDSALGYWVVIPGPDSGGSLDDSSVNTLALDKNNNLYAGTNAGNIYKYNNNTWNIVGTPVDIPITSISFNSDNNLYIGTEQDDDGRAHVYKYQNGDWLSLGSPANSGSISSMLIENNDIYVATSGDIEDGAIISQGQVYKHASGETWNAVSSFTDGSVNALASTNNIIYAATGTTNTDPIIAGKIYSYNGSSWTPLGNSPDGSAVTALDAVGSDIYAGTYGNDYDGQIYKYNAPNWQSVSTLNNAGGISNIVVRDSIIYASTADNGNLSGMVYTNISNTWNPLGKGAIDGTTVYAVSIDNNKDIYIGTQNNVFKYSKNNLNWFNFGNINDLDTSGVNAIITYESTVYAGTFAGNIYASNNDTANWNQLGNTMQDFQVSSLTTNIDGQLYASLNNLDEASDDPKPYGIIQRYTNGTWVTLNGAGEHDSLDNMMIQSVITDSIGNLYAGTGDLNNYSPGKVWEYKVGASEWQLVGLGTLDGSSVNSVALDKNMNLFAGTSDGNIFEYSNGSWIPLNTYSLDDYGISNISFTTSGNLYVTTSGGYVWKYLGSNLWINTNYGIGVSINTTGSSGM